MATLINLNDTTPVAPSNGQNVKWQSDASSPTNVSAYIALGSVTSNVLINLSGSIYGDSGFTYDPSSGIVTVNASATGGLDLINLTPATSGANYNSPLLTFGATYWDGSVSQQKLYTLQITQGSGANPSSALELTGGDLNFSGDLNVGSNIAAGSISSGGNVLLYGNTPATNVANITFGYLEIAGNYWTGSASAVDYWRLTQTLGTGSNPTSTLTLSHSGTSGVASFIFPTGFGVVQSLSNAPSTSSSTGVAGQIAWDASGYVYICTATNTWVRNPVAFTTF